MTNFKGISKIKKEKAEKAAIETELVNQFKNAIATYFKTVSFEIDYLGNKNSNYYSDCITNFSNSLADELKANKQLNSIKEIEYFNIIISDLLKDIVQFFIAIDNFNSRDRDNEVIDDIILFKTNIDDGLKNLGQFDLKIKDYFSKKDSSIAMKEYCLKVIKESFYFLNNRLYIDIEKCPLKSDYENLFNKLEHSISKEDIESAALLISTFKKKNRKYKDESHFLDFIFNVNNNKKIAQDLKETFNRERGIDFRIMIELLKDQNILIIGDRKFLLFYELVKIYFARNIGAYSGINDRYKHTDSDKKGQSKRIKIISEKLQPLIDKHKINK